MGLHVSIRYGVLRRQEGRSWEQARPRDNSPSPFPPLPRPDILLRRLATSLLDWLAELVDFKLLNFHCTYIELQRVGDRIYVVKFDTQSTLAALI